jgi:septal ring factor EnvC (AmiA/AmiB activator)
LEKFQSEIQRKAEEIDILQKDSEKHTQHVDLLEKQISQLHDLFKEKEQLILQCKEQETKLEDQVKEVLKAVVSFSYMGFLELLNIKIQFVIAESRIADCC